MEATTDTTAGPTRSEEGTRSVVATRTALDEGLRARLLEDGLVGAEELERASSKARSQEASLADTLLEAGALAHEELVRLCTDLLEVPGVCLESTPGDARVISALPRDKAFDLGVIPLFLIGHELTVACSRPYDLDSLDELRFITGKEILPVFALESDIQRHLVSYYGEYDPDFDPFVIEFESTGEEGDEGEILLEEGESDPPVVRLVNLVLSSSIAELATDIHLEPTRGQMAVRSRVDGLLNPKPYQIPAEIVPAVTSRIKILSKLDISEKRLPQDGKMRIRFRGRRVDVRVSTFPTIHGEKVVMRLLDKDRMDFKIDTIGMEPGILDGWKRLLQNRQGILLVTGPTGSGKSSTLYASLRHLHRPEVNIVTLEDPVEYELPGITQAQVNTTAGFTFATGLRSILRQDPDIVLLGEIRDLETAEIAIQAALTGHLVLATLHTNDAPSAVTRLVDIGVAPYLVAASLRGVLAQRLVRRICSGCASDAEPTEDERSLVAEALADGVPFHDGEGCTQCQHLGYQGRTGVHELLPVGPELRLAIASGSADGTLATLAAESGYRPLWHDGLAKARSGVTSLRELARSVPTAEHVDSVEGNDG